MSIYKFSSSYVSYPRFLRLLFPVLQAAEHPRQAGGAGDIQGRESLRPGRHSGRRVGEVCQVEEVDPPAQNTTRHRSAHPVSSPSFCRAFPLTGVTRKHQVPLSPVCQGRRELWWRSGNGLRGLRLLHLNLRRNQPGEFQRLGV